MNLIQLPLDLILVILQTLEPSQILILRQCCTVLHKLTQDRTLWIRKLAGLCATQNAPMDVLYRVHSMSQPQLEYTILRPLKFLKFLSSCQEYPESKQLLALPLPLTAHEAAAVTTPEYTGYTGVLLLGGGRFLFTNYKRRVISIWRLDNIDVARSDVRPLASLDADTLGLAQNDRARIQDSYVISGGGGLYLEVKLMYASGARKISIFQIDPSDDIPVFRLVGSRPCNDRYQSAFWDNILVYTDVTSLVIWDLESNCSASSPSSLPFFNMVQAFEGHVILLDPIRARYEALQIPEKVEIQQNDRQTIKLSSHGLVRLPDAASRDQWAIARGGTPMCCVASSNWLSGQQTYSFYSIGVPQPALPISEGQLSVHYQNKATAAFTTPEIAQPHGVFYVSNGTYMLPVNLVAGGLFGPDDAVTGIHLAVCQRTSSGFENKLVRLYRPSGDVISFDLCPISGRMVVVEDGKITISQYVS